MECLLTVVVQEINLNLGVFGTLKNMCEKCFYIFLEGVEVVYKGRILLKIRYCFAVRKFMLVSIL